MVVLYIATVPSASPGRACSVFFFRVLHTIFSHLRAHAFDRPVTVARSSAVQASSSRRQERRWAIVCGSPQSQSTDWASSRYPHLLITVFARPTPVRSRLRARQHSQSSPDPAGKDSGTSSPISTEAGMSVRLSPEPQSAAACRRVKRRDCAHKALPRLQSATSWLVMEQLVSGVWCLSCAFHAAGNSPPDVRRSDTVQYVYAVQVRWFEAAQDDSATVV